VFTEYRNHISHRSGIEISRYGNLSLGNDIQKITVTRNEIEQFTKLGLSICDGLWLEGGGVAEEKTRHIAYQSANALSKYHKQELKMPHPVVWYQVCLGLGYSDLDVNSQMRWTVDLDRILQVIHNSMPPESGESIECEMIIYLHTPNWMTSPNSDPKFFVPTSRIKQGGILELARRDFTS
jgi:hypothetical protein